MARSTNDASTDSPRDPPFDRVALSATALVWEFAGQHPWVAVAVAVWMYPGIAVN
ncbi:MAG: hypothetical protein R2713_18775 [Ilumatobacteraceae bacterium]